MAIFNNIETRLSCLRPVSQDELAEKILSVPLRARQYQQRRRERFIAFGGVLTGTIAGTLATFLLMTTLSVPQIEVREIVKEVVREVVVEVPAPKPKPSPEPVYVSPSPVDVKPINLDEMIAKREALAKRAKMFASTPIYPHRFRWNESAAKSSMEYRNLLQQMTQ
ncbi:hypothetical protein FACS189454_05550 [Planctomycetales bacterium]|nr:hypothetical protein FACS189454_05550 [Planctomycetales bacterium]